MDFLTLGFGFVVYGSVDVNISLWSNISKMAVFRTLMQAFTDTLLPVFKFVGS